MSLVIRHQTEHANEVRPVLPAQGAVGQLARVISRVVSLWQPPNPPPQQQQNPYQQPPPGQQTPWGPPPPGYGGPPMPYQSGAGIKPRQVVGGLLMLFGAIIMLMFFVVPWASFDSSSMADAVRDVVRDSDYADRIGFSASDIDEDSFDSIDGCQYTGLQIATRSDGNSDCSDLEEDDSDDEYEPASMPLIEHSVFAMPALGFLILLFGFMLMLGSGSPSAVLAISLMVALVLVVFPFGWSVAYNAAYRQFNENTYTDGEGTADLSSDRKDAIEYQGDVVVALISSSYQTIIQTIVPLLVLITVIAGFFVAGSGNKQPQFQPPYGQPMNPYQQQQPPPPGF